MKATIDIPDALFRQIESQAAIRGRSVRDVTVDLYERWLAEIRVGSGTPAAADAWLAGWDAIGRAVATNAVDPRPASEIVIAERR